MDERVDSVGDIISRRMKYKSRKGSIWYGSGLRETPKPGPPSMLDGKQMIISLEEEPERVNAWERKVVPDGTAYVDLKETPRQTPKDYESDLKK